MAASALAVSTAAAGDGEELALELGHGRVLEDLGMKSGVQARMGAGEGGEAKDQVSEPVATPEAVIQLLRLAPPGIAASALPRRAEIII